MGLVLSICILIILLFKNKFSPEAGKSKNRMFFERVAAGAAPTIDSDTCTFLEGEYISAH